MTKAVGNIQLAAKFLEQSCHLRSVGIAGNVRQRFAARTIFLRRAADDVVVGEIGGRFVGAGTVEIGYPVVPRAGVRAMPPVRRVTWWSRARASPGIERVVAHAPVDRPASGRLPAKAGFTCHNPSVTAWWRLSGRSRISSPTKSGFKGVERLVRSELSAHNSPSPQSRSTSRPRSAVCLAQG